MTYWMVSLGLVLFGFVGALSIGRPFLLVGLTMLLVGRWRHRPAVFLPPLLAMMAYNLAFSITVPLTCTASETIGVGSTNGQSLIRCSNLLGMTWSGPGILNPSLEPAHQAGLVAGVLVLVATLIRVRMLRARRPGRA